MKKKKTQSQSPSIFTQRPNRHLLNSNPSTMTRDRNSIDPKTGFCKETRTYHSLRKPVTLPDPSTPLDITTFTLSLNSTSTPNHSALIDATTGRRLSYTELRHHIETLAATLQSTLNLTKGQTAFILSPATIEIPILYLSLLSIGIIISPSNPSNTASEILRQTLISKPQIAFADSSNAHKIPNLPLPTVIIDSPSFAVLFSRPVSGRKPVVIDQRETAAILFSSGTTGLVKGVELTHRNFIAGIVEIHSLVTLGEERVEPGVLLLTSPLFHILGFSVCFKAVAAAETLVVMKRFEFGVMVKALEEFRVTTLIAAPPVVVAMTKMEVAMKHGFRSLEYVLCGGASLGKEVIKKFGSKFPGVPIAQGYGMTESASVIFSLYGLEECRHFGSAGRVMANFEVKIVDPKTSSPLSPCQQGEIWIRGPTIMKGYIHDEESSDLALDSAGWFRTGDLGYIDNEGFLFLVDRLKELIKYKAYQVAPAELEQLLQSHPEILDAAVIPYPHEEVGQIPMACVVRQHGSTLTEVKVMDFIAKQVAPYKKIRRVLFVSSIPKSPAGKILRRDLIKHALSKL